MTARTSAGERPDRSHRRALRVLGLCLLGVAVLGVVWLVVTGLVARSQLTRARTELAELRSAVASGDDASAQRLTGDIADHAGTAHRATTGPAWWVAANVPGLGSPLRTARVITAQADRLGAVLPAVLHVRHTVTSVAHGAPLRVDLPTVRRGLPALEHATTATHAAYRAVETADDSWLPAVGSARRSFGTALQHLDGELAGADRAARLAVPMLGAQRPQRYFVGFLNEAEARGLGGIPGAFAIATASHGRITFDHFGSDLELAGVRAGVRLGAEFDARYAGSDPTTTIQNSDLSPDFGSAARIWAGMWQAKSGERIDGALAVDPTALSYLLRVTGPLRLSSGGSVSAANVVALTQETQYARFPGLDKKVSDTRKNYLTDVARAVSSHLTTSGDPADLIKALSQAARERRLMLWSRHPALERQIRDAGWGGMLGNDRPAPYAGFVVNNATGSKLDYYLRRRMTYRRSDCGTGGVSTATIALTNDAPRSGLPSYVTFRAHTPPRGARPGDNNVLLSYYADRSARIRTVTVDGQSRLFVAQPEGDTIAVTTAVELPVGRTVTVTVQIDEPRATGPVTLLRQPLARPLQVDLRGDRCR